MWSGEDECGQTKMQVPSLLGGDFFFLACEDFGRMFDYLFPAFVFFSFVLFFFGGGRGGGVWGEGVVTSSCTLIPFFMRGSVHNGSAN